MNNAKLFNSEDFFHLQVFDKFLLNKKVWKFYAIWFCQVRTQGILFLCFWTISGWETCLWAANCKQRRWKCTHY